MRYATARAFRSAIEARLKSIASKYDQRALVQIRKQIAFDRFLARLLAVSPGKWTLKGGVALQYRLGAHSRFTKDLDLVLPSGAEVVSDIILNAIASEVDDYFTFSLQQSQQLDHGAEGSSVRFTLRAGLDGRLFENIVVDIGFDELSPLPVETISGTDFLEFAGIPSITAPILPIEVHLAEKLHAYARSYSGDRQSSRVKDLIDIVLIGQSFPLKASACIGAVRHTFASRVTHQVPSRFVLPPENWSAPYAALATSVSLDPDIAVGHAYAARMLDPLLGGEIDDAAIWNASAGEWRTGRPGFGTGQNTGRGHRPAGTRAQSSVTSPTCVDPATPVISER